ncbi:MAG: DUF1343 domain-containing protein [Phycisphaeraceae bacterium]
MPRPSYPRMQLGIDRLLTGDVELPPASSVGMLTHSPAVVGGDPTRPSYVALHDAGVPITRLFSPEHGLAANAADGETVPNDTDYTTGLPIVSLYGDHLEPPPDSLADLDLLVIDLQDIGARSYTYTWTLWHALHAAARTQTPCLLLDRPNPITCDLDACEGPMLDPACATFLGRYPMPIRHSLTLGELARHWVDQKIIDASLAVLTMHGYDRGMSWQDTGLPWTPSSPAIRRPQTAWLYPALCFLEATTLSLGRGTPHPFEAVLGPSLNAEPLAEAINNTWGDLLKAQPIEATPDNSRQEGSRLSGVHLEVIDTDNWRPVSFGLWLLAEIMASHPDHFAWASYPTRAHPSGQDHLIRLLGVSDAVTRIEQAAALEAGPRRVILQQSTACPAWRETVSHACLYT